MKRSLALALLCLTPFVVGARRRAVRSGPGSEYVRSVIVNGIVHAYHVYVPSSYDGVREVPLLFFFHGGGGNATQGEQTVHLRATAEKHGFILVRPEGYDASGFGG